MCLCGVWRVSERSLEYVLKVSGSCLEGVLNVSERWTQRILEKHFENGVIVKTYKSKVDPI